MVILVHNDNVTGVARAPFNLMGKMLLKSKDTIGWYATALTYGKYLLTVFYSIRISRLKADYCRHRGLSQEHRLQYLKWYCYFENTN